MPQASERVNGLGLQTEGHRYRRSTYSGVYRYACSGQVHSSPMENFLTAYDPKEQTGYAYEVPQLNHLAEFGSCHMIPHRF
jgi:hypothetical protein